MVLDNDPTGFTSSNFGGTLRFMAPEQLSEEGRSTQTDVYAYACTYAEVCTHRTLAIFLRSSFSPFFVDHDW
jgi:serine/threonine protein kinase